MSDASAVVDDRSAPGAAGVATSATRARFPDVQRGEGPNGSPIWRTPRVAVVIPSNRPAELETWLDAWSAHLEGVALYVVKDEPETWEQIDEALGQASWVIPRQTDCIRSWGYLQAHRDGADYIVTLDDDCLPDEPADALKEHIRALTTMVEPPGWGRTLPDLATRGLPAICPVVVNHGLWSGIPDVSGKTQLAGYRQPFLPAETLLDVGKFYPLSGMNLSWARAMTPAMYFGLMGSRPNGSSWGVHRYGDIWAGLMAKRIADQLGWRIRSGTPFVYHSRASDPTKNEQLERAAEGLTPYLAQVVATTALPQHGAIQAQVVNHARALADALPRLQGDYWRWVSNAWHRWIDWTS